MKSILYNSLVRSKLTYGFESIYFKPKDIKNLLTKLEANQIKASVGISRQSKTTALLYAMDIRPIAMQLYKRKLGFIVQLANNEATSNLLREKRHSTLKDVIESLDVDLESTHEYIGCLKFNFLFLFLFIF
jgi:hypothetical protein